jgi:hypothetical protein
MPSIPYTATLSIKSTLLAIISLSDPTGAPQQSSTRANDINDHQFETLNRDDLVAVIEPMITVFNDMT